MTDHLMPHLDIALRDLLNRPRSKRSLADETSLAAAAREESAAADASHPLVSLQGSSGPFDACEGAQDFGRMGRGVVWRVADAV